VALEHHCADDRSLLASSWLEAYRWRMMKKTFWLKIKTSERDWLLCAQTYLRHWTEPGVAVEVT
jgi:hypothetical protein